MAAGGAQMDEMDAARQSAVEARREAVQAALAKGKPAEAVAAALENPPLGTKLMGLKAANYEVVMTALVAVRDDHISSVAAKLSVDQVDTLIKYVYKAMEAGQECGKMLKWHAAGLKQTGLSSIVRAMTERKGV